MITSPENRQEFITSSQPEDVLEREQIPNLETLDKAWEKTIDFEWKGRNYSGKFYVARVNQSFGGVMVDLSFRINTLIDDYPEQIAYFSGVIRKGPAKQVYQNANNNSEIIAGLTARRVEPEFRAQGLGEKGTAVFLKMIDSIVLTNPSYKPVCVEVYTSFSTVGRMLLDQKYLEQHNLAQFKKRPGAIDFGFVPDPADEGKLANYLNTPTKAQAVLDRSDWESDIRLIKKLG